MAVWSDERPCATDRLKEKEAGSPGFADTDVVEYNHVSKNRTAPAVLNLKTLLNHAQPIPGFVYDQIEFLKVGETGRVDVSIRAHGQSHPKCSKCLKPRSEEHTSDSSHGGLSRMPSSA